MKFILAAAYSVNRAWSCCPEVGHLQSSKAVAKRQKLLMYWRSIEVRGGIWILRNLAGVRIALI